MFESDHFSQIGAFQSFSIIELALVNSNCGLQVHKGCLPEYRWSLKFGKSHRQASEYANDKNQSKISRVKNARCIWHCFSCVAFLRQKGIASKS